MFWIHFIGMLEVHKSLAEADFWTCLVRRLPRQFIQNTNNNNNYILRCCWVGVQINSSALETFTKVLHDRSIKPRYRENLVTKHSTFSYLSCDYIMYALVTATCFDGYYLIFKKEWKQLQILKHFCIFALKAICLIIQKSTK